MTEMKARNLRLDGEEGVEQAPEERAPQQATRLRRAVKIWPAAGVFILFLIAWQVVAATAFSGKSYLLPDPLSVAQKAWELRESILLSAGSTLLNAVIAYAIAIVVGILFAVFLAESKFLERSFYPWAVIAQVTPIIAIAPIIIIWFGFGQVSIIVIALMIAFFPILNNTHLGLISTDRNQLELFQLHNASWFARFWNLRLPGAIPSIIGGLRISAGLAITGTILGEFVIGTAGTYGGIGVRIITAQATLKTTQLFVYVVAATLLGLFFFGFVTYIGHRLLRDWHESARTEIVE